MEFRSVDAIGRHAFELASSSGSIKKDTNIEIADKALGWDRGSKPPSSMRGRVYRRGGGGDASETKASDSRPPSPVGTKDALNRVILKAARAAKAVGANVEDFLSSLSVEEKNALLAQPGLDPELAADILINTPKEDQKKLVMPNDLLLEVLSYCSDALISELFIEPFFTNEELDGLSLEQRNMVLALPSTNARDVARIIKYAQYPSALVISDALLVETIDYEMGAKQINALPSNLLSQYLNAENCDINTACIILNGAKDLAGLNIPGKVLIHTVIYLEQPVIEKLLPTLNLAQKNALLSSKDLPIALATNIVLISEANGDSGLIVPDELLADIFYGLGKEHAKNLPVDLINQYLKTPGPDPEMVAYIVTHMEENISALNIPANLVPAILHEVLDGDEVYNLDMRAVNHLLATPGIDLESALDLITICATDKTQLVIPEGVFRKFFVDGAIEHADFNALCQMLAELRPEQLYLAIKRKGTDFSDLFAPIYQETLLSFVSKEKKLAILKLPKVRSYAMELLVENLMDEAKKRGEDPLNPHFFDDILQDPAVSPSRKARIVNTWMKNGLDTHLHYQRFPADKTPLDHLPIDILAQMKPRLTLQAFYTLSTEKRDEIDALQTPTPPTSDSLHDDTAIVETLFPQEVPQPATPPAAPQASPEPPAQITPELAQQLYALVTAEGSDTAYMISILPQETREALLAMEDAPQELKDLIHKHS